jgi:signal peptidase I
VTDDDQAVGEPVVPPTGGHGEGSEEDRRAVRSETEGVAPDETPVAAGPGPATGEAAAGKTGDQENKDEKKQTSFWKELPILIVVALALALVIKTFVVQAFYIPSGSMENTLLIGDRILVNKIVYHTRDIQRGDVVVFNGVDSWTPESNTPQPTNPISKALRAVGGAFGLVPGETDFVKRVIGVPGDHVKSAGGGAPVLVNGHPLDEKSYLYTGNAPSNEAFDITVPKGRLWVMGDHRADSYDSRGHNSAPGGGSIPANKVIGRAFVVVWPVSHWNTLPIPDTFQQQGLAALAPAAPLALGFAGALPVPWLYRRLRSRR